MNLFRTFSALVALSAMLAAPARAQFLFGTKDTDGAMAANSDSRIPTQKAVVTYVAAHSVPFTTLTVTASTGTFTLADSKTLTVSNTLTFAGTDSTTMTFPGTSGTVATIAATQTFTNKTLTAPTINGGTATALTGLAIRSSGAAFDLTLASSEVLTAGRTLSLNVGNAARTLTLSGSPTLSGITTTGTGTLALGTKTLTASNTLTLAGTDGTTMTFPTTTATIARTDAAQTFTGVQTMTSPVLVTPAIGVATGTSLAVTGLLTSSSASAGIGYATGAGGTVTQLTDRSTGVTINKTSGAITTDATSLAAGAEATFTVTNSSVAVGDVVVISTRSGQTAGTSIAVVTRVAAGAFDITLTNLHASTADTGAMIINFAVIKAVSA